MIQSKFRFTVCFPLLIMLIIIATTCFIIFDAIKDGSIPVLVVYFILSIAMFFFFAWALLGELKKKVNSVKIENSTIISKNYLGLGSSQKISFDAFEGFTTSILSTTSNDYEYLYLMKDDKKTIILSEFYHRNYSELKKTLQSKTKFLGDKPFSMSREIKEIFK
jgi:hypothetical protein